MAKKTYFENPVFYQERGVNIDQATKWATLLLGGLQRAIAEGKVRDRATFITWAPTVGIENPADYWDSAQEHYNNYYYWYEHSDVIDPDQYPEEVRTWRIPIMPNMRPNYSLERERREDLGWRGRSWDGLAEQAAEWEQKHGYTGKKFAEITTLRDFITWTEYYNKNKSKEEGELSLNAWTNRKFSKANKWQEYIERVDYQDKNPRGKKKNEEKWRANPLNIGLGSISSKEEFLRLRSLNPNFASLPEDFWEQTADIRQEHTAWREAYQWEDLKTTYRDKKEKIRDKDFDNWRKNLQWVGIEHIKTEEEFVLWQKADRSRKSFTLELWRNALRLAAGAAVFNMPLELQIKALEAQEALTNAPRVELRAEQIPLSDEVLPRSGEFTIPNPSAAREAAEEIEAELADAEAAARGAEAPVLTRTSVPTPAPPPVSMTPPEEPVDEPQEQQGPPPPGGRDNDRKGSGLANNLRNRLGRQLIMRAVAAVGQLIVATMPVWLPILAVLLPIILLLVLILFGDKEGEPFPVTMDKKCQTEVQNGQIIECGLLASFASADSAVVEDTIPENAVFDSADGVYELLDEAGQVITAATDEEKARVRKVRWKYQGTGTDKPGESTLDTEKYKSEYGYDFAALGLNPNDVKNIELLPNMGHEGKQRWDNYAVPAVQAVDGKTGMDIGLIAMIAIQETTFDDITPSGVDQYLEKCQGKEHRNVNTFCSNWATWQVGYGIKPAEALAKGDRIKEAFTAMRPSANIAQLGKDIIANSKIRNTIYQITATGPAYEFPTDITLDAIIQGAREGNPDRQHLLGILLKDELISLYLIGKELEDLQANKQVATLADELERINRNFYEKKKAGNVIISVYNSFSFKQGGPIQGSTTMKIRLKPKQENSWVVNIATVTASGGSAGAGSKVFDTNSKTLQEMFQQSAQAYRLPVALLKAVAHLETGGVAMQYSESEVVFFSKDKWWVGLVDEAPTLAGNDDLIERGFGYNTCQYKLVCGPGNDVRGMMQFLKTTWEGEDGNGGVKKTLSFTDGHDPDRRINRDAILGAGSFIREMTRGNPEFGFPEGDTGWTDAQVRAVGLYYCTGDPRGNGTDAACGSPGNGYDEVLSTLYKKYSSL